MPAPLYLSLHALDFAAQSLVRLRPELRNRPVVILDGDPPLETIFALNDRSRSLGLEAGMSRLQAESFDGLALCPRVREQEESAFTTIMKCGEKFSPRIEVLASPEESSSGATLVLDVSASERLLGTPEQVAILLRRNIDIAGVEVSIATSSNAYAAILAARGFRGITIIPPGQESRTLARLPLTVLELEPEHQETFTAWGIKTLGALAVLPENALIARIGQAGYRLQALSRGEFQHLLVPVEPSVDAILSESTELEHPVDLLEPLLFLLGRMLEQIIVRAAEHTLAIAYVETRLILEGAPRREHRRVVRPALPEANHHTLLKLIQLDLEMHPPQAAVIGLYMLAQPARPQTGQQELFVPQTPESGQLEILLARLRKLLGEDRLGSPELIDSHRPDAFRLVPFAPHADAASLATGGGIHTSALRMFRPPQVVRVEMESSRIITLFLDGKKLPVHKASGPWKTSGAWWTNSSWCREEWDVTLGEHKSLYCRLAFDPGARCWYLVGIYD
jgi:protein ImuB